MIKKEVRVRDGLLKESRPTAHLVQEASQYVSQIYIEVENKKINAKSIMGMMSLQLAGGENLSVTADGEDEKEALEGVESFLVRG
ncbi:MAG: HPr family phosphocarrier protein [Lachnospiraceae bacterium]|jgi:catabolite repression HPr-like protein|nr:HPr family phosphocarrier protein [Lachnospiraceae bacterium]